LFLLKEELVKNFQSIVAVMNQSTADQYLCRLKIFKNFLNKEFYGLTINCLVNRIKDESIDPFNILTEIVVILEIVIYLQLQ
jgi:hypothetical protein